MYRTSFFTSALFGDERSASRPGYFTLQYALYRRLGGPERRLGQRWDENILVPTDTPSLIHSSSSPQTTKYHRILETVLVVQEPNQRRRTGGNRRDWNNSVYEIATVCVCCCLHAVLLEFFCCVWNRNSADSMQMRTTSFLQDILNLIGFRFVAWISDFMNTLYNRGYIHS
jgi:hypothetical protein